MNRIAVIILVAMSCTNKTQDKSLPVDNKEADYITEEVVSLDTPETEVPYSLYTFLDHLIKVDSIKPFGSKILRISSVLVPDINKYYLLTNNFDLIENKSKLQILTQYKDDLISNIDGTKSYKLYSDKLTNVQLVPSDSIYFIGDNMTTNFVSPKAYYQFFTPLISSDGLIAVVSIDFICSGLCGQGNYVFLQKQNNKWVKIGSIVTWIS